MAVTLCACSEGINSHINDNSAIIMGDESIDTEKKSIEKEPEGIQADGKGEVIPLSKEEKTYVLEYQMEQYHKNGIDESVFVTACDIYDIDESIYTIK